MLPPSTLRPANTISDVTQMKFGRVLTFGEFVHKVLGDLL